MARKFVPSAAALRRPGVWLVGLAALAALGYGAAHGWAWYQFRAGWDALVNYEHAAAADHFHACLRVWPGDVPARVLAARAARRLGRLAEAEAHLDAAGRPTGEADAEAVAFEWALVRATAGDLDAVEEPLQARVLSRPADAPLAWEGLAQGYRRMYRLPDALACLDAWLRLDPDNFYATFLRGEVHRQVGAVSRARDEYRRAVDLRPDHDDARRLLARCLVQLGRYEEAAGHLDALLRKHPDDADLGVWLARSLHDLGQRDPAAARLDHVLRTHPDHGPALRERGRQAAAAGRFDDAETWFRRAVRAVPHDYEAQWGLHQALQGAGKAAAAKAQLARAQDLKDRIERISEIQSRRMTERPRDPALHAELGELLIGIGEAESGERWLQSTLRLDPHQPAAHAALAALYDRRGDPARAAQHRRPAGTAARSLP